MTTEAKAGSSTLRDALREAQHAAGLIEEGVALLRSFLNDPDASEGKGGWFIAEGLGAQADRLSVELNAAERINLKPAVVTKATLSAADRAALTRKIVQDVVPDLPSEQLPAFQRAYEAEAAEHPKMMVATLAGRALARMERETAA